MLLENTYGNDTKDIHTQLTILQQRFGKIKGLGICRF
jgi:hypothetical protein